MTRWKEDGFHFEANKAWKRDQWLFCAKRPHSNQWWHEKTGSSIPCSGNGAGSGLRRPLLRDQLCDFCTARAGFLFTKLSFDQQNRSVLPYRRSGNFLKVLGKKIYDFSRLVMARIKFCWLRFLGLSNNRMLDPVFSRDQGEQPAGRANGRQGRLFC